MREKSAPAPKSRAPKSRGERTADAIERAAVDLVVEHGYDAVTVAMICEAVGISQRTFFNHYPAKEDALLGRHMPRVDQSAARRFIVSRGPVLLDAVGLVGPSPNDSPVPFAERMRVIGTHPALLMAQMQRIFELEEELGEIIQLRVRTEHPELPEDEVEPVAVMVTNLIAGVVRAIGHLSEEESRRSASGEGGASGSEAVGDFASGDGEDTAYDDIVERTRKILATVLEGTSN